MKIKSITPKSTKPRRVPQLSQKATSRAQRIIYEELHRVNGWKKTTATNIWICCPFHGETQPSFGINIDPSNIKVSLGTGHCFGCGKTKGWNEIAEKLHLRKLKELDFVQTATSKRDLDEEAARLLAEPTNGVGKLAKSLAISMYIDFPRDQVWRTIKGSIMNYVGARLVYDNYSQDNAVLLPCYVDDELVGGIKAIIERDETDKKQLAYLTSEGKWVRKYGLYPYDAALTLMKEKGLRVLVVVEGPRDALRLIQHGIPAVAILGTQNWSVTKKNLLLSSGADYIVLMMDGDASGRSAQKKMYAALHNSIATKKIALSKYSRQLEKKIDPGNCPRAVLTQLKTWVYSVKD